MQSGRGMTKEEKERAAKLAEQEGKPELARLIRGEATPQELAEQGVHNALVEFAQELGGVVVDETWEPSSQKKSVEELKRALTELNTRDFQQDFRDDMSRLRMTPEQAEEQAKWMREHPHLLRADPVRPASQRIEDLLGKISAQIDKMEEEIMFTSSANRYAHLRSGIEKNTIPHLPPAPDWNTLETYVEPFMRDILDHIKGAPILRERATVTGLLPMDVLKGVDIVGRELLQIVAERGRAYGEESILAMGEAGMISMIMAKVMRLMWSHRGGAQFQSRRDSYIDLAGYCLLTIALDQFITEESGKEEKTNDVENGNMGELAS